ncbi:hypothetical protein QJS10_CPB13g01599 [Acorus calamus]|uniref:Pentatricopeptide repeat-containing protein n=1 Tax=Acorus calamus TaxID=4465 RepID=A0AAV9DGQ9_ACOCL|nr:hypothetical protein QJS10_CPB13g01599 [Acorus calamus]
MLFTPSVRAYRTLRTTSPKLRLFLHRHLSIPHSDSSIETLICESLRSDPLKLEPIVSDPQLFLRALRSIRARPVIVVRFFRWAEAHPRFDRAGSTAAFVAVLEILAASGFVGPARSFVDRALSLGLHGVVDLLIERRGAVSEAALKLLLDLVLYVYGKNSMTRRSLSTFYKMVYNGLAPDVKYCNWLLRNLRDEGLSDMASAVYEVMVHNGIGPSIITYNTMLDLYCKEGELWRALDLLSEMQKNGVSPSSITYNVLINGLSKSGKLG